MIIRGFWHMYLVNHWYSIVIDQLRIMKASGLYDACADIQIGVVVPENSTQLPLLYKLIIYPNPKLRVAYVSYNPTDYEFKTLQLIESSLLSPISDYAGFYIHTKSVTKPNDTINNYWRAWLNEAILHRWRQRYSDINLGFDVSSVNYCTPPKHPYHFSGNFWWFDAEYIFKLPQVARLNWKNRYLAEQWICKGNGKYSAKEFIEPGQDIFYIKQL